MSNEQQPAAPPRETHLTPKELSARLKGAVTTDTLAMWRWRGKGPVFLKFGGKQGRVVYLLSDVIAWERDCRMSSTKTKAPPMAPVQQRPSAPPQAGARPAVGGGGVQAR